MDETLRTFIVGGLSALDRPQPDLAKLIRAAETKKQSVIFTGASSTMLDSNLVAPFVIGVSPQNVADLSEGIMRATLYDKGGEYRVFGCLNQGKVAFSRYPQGLDLTIDSINDVIDLFFHLGRNVKFVYGGTQSEPRKYKGTWQALYNPQNVQGTFSMQRFF